MIIAKKCWIEYKSFEIAARHQQERPEDGGEGLLCEGDHNQDDQDDQDDITQPIKQYHHLDKDSAQGYQICKQRRIIGSWH